ncbi:MAG: ribosomal protein S18-alanine N-acetyltransferase [Chloroflexota bacterium]
MSALTAEVVIRPMTLDDLPDVLQIDRLSFPLPWPERSYRFELTENPSSTLLVATRLEDGQTRIAGYIGFWLIIDEAHISTLAVHPRFRRLGIGSDLLDAALDRAARQGADVVTLEVRVSNQAAVNLYHRFGFKVVGRREKYYRDNDEDALLMTLTGLRQRRARTGGGGV